MALRNIMPYYYTNLDNGEQLSTIYSTVYRDVRGNHSQIIRSNGAASLSLLNVNNAPLLSALYLMAIFGAHAGPVVVGTDGGSGNVITSFQYFVTLHDALLQRAIDDGTIFRWVMNNTYTTSGTSFVSKESGGTGFPTGTNTATSYAGDMEVWIVFLNAYSGEGADRTELTNAGRDVIVISVASECNNTMVDINTVGARILDTWIDNENATAMVYEGLLGQNSGYSVMDSLYGAVNPSGPLPYTIAKSETEYPALICLTAVCNFIEGNYIDYKYFNAYNITPRYEFSYSSLDITQTTTLNNIYSTEI